MTLLTNSDYVLDLEEEVQSPNEKIRRVILSTQFTLISLAMRFMELVLAGSTTTFARTNSPWARMELTEIGKMLPRINQLTELYSRGHRFHPYLSFFFEEYRKHPIKDCGQCFYGDIAANGKQVTAVFDDFIATLRGHAAAANLRKKAA